MVGALKTWFRSTVDVRPGEYGALALMSAYGFLSITSYYVIKPARNSIFVDRVGADQLPWVYIATAIIVVFVVIGYSKYVDRVGRKTLIFSSMAALGTSLVAFWWLLSNREGFASSGAFYVYTKLYPLFLVSQFWLVANLLFTTTQARRLFGLIGMGLILGASQAAAYPDSQRSIGAVGCLLRYGGTDQRDAGLREVEALAEHEDPTRREVAAELLGRMEALSGRGEELLERLVRDLDLTVRRRAMRTIGRARAHRLAPLLLDRLDDPAYRLMLHERCVQEGDDPLLCSLLLRRWRSRCAVARCRTNRV